MVKQFWKGFFFSFLILGIIGGVIGVGFHSANEILPGTFEGNYHFKGSTSDTPGTGILQIGSSTTYNYLFRISESENRALMLDAYYSAWRTNPIMTWRRDNGRVGIGTDNPKTLLELKNGQLTIDTSQDRKIILNDIHNYSFGVNDGIDDYFFIYDDTNAKYRLTITENGSVGIGTVTPGSKLTVIGNISSTDSLKAKQICDETGANCNDLSSGLGGGNLNCTNEIATGTGTGATATCGLDYVVTGGGVSKSTAVVTTAAYPSGNGYYASFSSSTSYTVYAICCKIN